MGGTADRITAGASLAEQNAAPWIQRFARLGYIAKGLVYTLIAVLAMRGAFGSSAAANTRGALDSLLDQPFGRIILGLVGIGLVCYALWRLYQGARNPEGDNVAVRIAHVGAAFIHAGFAVTAARLALAGGSSGREGAATESNTTRATAEALQQPLGSWLVGGVGCAFVAHAGWQLYRAATTRLDDQLDMSAARPARRAWLVRAARFGIAARGIIFLFIGGSLVRAGFQSDASEALDFAGALRAFEQPPFGSWLLALIAVGLFAYGVYEFIRARYRMIRPRNMLPPTQIRLRQL